MSYVGRGLLLKYLPKPVQNWINKLQFRPGNPKLMEPSPAARETDEAVPRIQGYRYPAPGSRPPPRIPRVESPDDVFDIKYYSRDTVRQPRKRYVLANKAYLSEEQKKKAVAIDAEPPKQLNWGSTGKFGNPAVKEYDPTGLRSSMTATYEALEASLEKHQPDHLPTPVWWDEYDEICAKHEAQGRPIPLGRPTQWIKPAGLKKASW
mmetsp:Transcript_21133/g.84242  ORF Transcript_21133/g.84242 Transcript_21133/m.84242 type:complete len:207 (-) Transcript_21133:448-1068(-)